MSPDGVVAETPPSIGHERVVVRVPNWLGDSVMARRCVALIIQKHGISNVCAVAHSRVADYWRAWPGLRVMELDPTRSRMVAGLSMIRALRRHGAAIVGYLLTPSFSSAALFALSGIKRRVGFVGNARGFLLSHPLPRNRVHGRWHYSTTLCTLAGGTDHEWSAAAPEFDWTAEAELRVRVRLEQAGIMSGTYVVVAVGSGGLNRRYPPDAWHEVISRVAAHMPVILTGTHHDRALASQAGLSKIRSVLDWCGTTSVPELALLLEKSAGFAGSDSGTAHLAASMGCPAVVLFGAGDEVETGPRGPTVHVVRTPVWCAPCRTRICSRTDAPLECMRSIPPQLVASSLLAVSGRAQPAPGTGTGEQAG